MTIFLILLLGTIAVSWLAVYAVGRLDRPRATPRSHAVDPDFLPAACRG